VRIDHVLLVAGDIDATAGRLSEQYGLASVPGGRHPQWGTANRIVPLGGPYLEIIGVSDPARAAQHPLGQWVGARAAGGVVLAGVMVEPDDFDAVCTRLSLTPVPGERGRPDKTVLSWRLAGVAEALTRTVPCFISWDRREVFDDQSGASGIEELELGGDADEIGEWLRGSVEGLRLVGGAPGIRALTVTTAAGPVVLTEHP